MLVPFPPKLPHNELLPLPSAAELETVADLGILEERKAGREKIFVNHGIPAGSRRSAHLMPAANSAPRRPPERAKSFGCASFRPCGASSASRLLEADAANSCKPDAPTLILKL